MRGTEGTDRRGWWGLLALTLGLLAARLVYLAWWCPYGLVEDEAQYWDWSRHLALSYYTKGPGVAWTIRAAASVLGETELAVRVMGPLSSAVLMVCAGVLLKRVSGSWRIGVMGAAATQCAPVFAATALLGTIDGPYAACWAGAALAGWSALRRGAGWAWVAVGLLLGVGFLYKYTVLLLVPGLVLFAVTAGRDEGEGRRPARWWVGLGLVAFVVAAAPVWIWNQQQGWPTVRHLLGHLGFAEPGLGSGLAAVSGPKVREAWSPKGLGEFVGAQFALVGPLLVLAGWAAWGAWRGRGAAGGAGRWYLAACGLPILVFYLLVAIVTEPEGNWALGGYVTWMPLAGWAAWDGLVERARRRGEGAWRGRTETFGQVLWHWGVGYGLVAGLMMPRLDLLAGVPVIGRFVPVGRLNQGPTLAGGVEAARVALRAERGGEPMVMAMHYGPASQLAFYLPGQPVTFCAQSRFGGRPTNHDYWPATDLAAPALRGRDAVLIGGGAEEWGRVFARVEDLGVVAGLERRGVRHYRGLEYRGFGAGTPAASPTP